MRRSASTPANFSGHVKSIHAIRPQTQAVVDHQPDPARDRRDCVLAILAVAPARAGWGKFLGDHVWNYRIGDDAVRGAVERAKAISHVADRSRGNLVAGAPVPRLSRTPIHLVSRR